MANCTEQIISIAGCRIRLMRGGAGRKLLILHGAGGAPTWHPDMTRQNLIAIAAEILPHFRDREPEPAAAEANEGKAFFFEKKKQKTFSDLC